MAGVRTSRRTGRRRHRSGRRAAQPPGVLRAAARGRPESPAGCERRGSASRRSRWSCRSRPRPGSWRRRPATANCSRRRTPARRGGTHGCAATATPAARACARASARGTPGTTAARAGRACRRAVPAARPATCRRCRRCRDCAPTCRRRCTADGSRSPRWPARSGRTPTRSRWLAEAEAIRRSIVARLYSAEDAAFYDVDAHDRFVRIRGDVISRVLGEHVVDQDLFETIYRRQIRNPSAFWSAYPLPSIAMDDPAFVRPIPRNSWGGASQALTALRAPRWMEHYGKAADLAHLMQQWTRAIVRDGRFLQQMDPTDGTFTPDLRDYSPAALCFTEFTWRLSGVRRAGDLLGMERQAARAPRAGALSPAHHADEHGGAALCGRRSRTAAERQGRPSHDRDGAIRDRRRRDARRGGRDRPRADARHASATSPAVSARSPCRRTSTWPCRHRRRSGPGRAFESRTGPVGARRSRDTSSCQSRRENVSREEALRICEYAVGLRMIEVMFDTISGSV